MYPNELEATDKMNFETRLPRRKYELVDTTSVEFRELRWAIEAAQHRSLRQAAEALKVRQSSLSRRLRSLEHRLGTVLFDRTNGGTRPTIAGQEFLKAACRIVQDTEEVLVRLKLWSRGEGGRLTIGVHASLSAGNLRAALIEYQRRFPDVEMHLVDGSSDHLQSDLVNYSIDIAFVVEGSSRGTPSLFLSGANVWSPPCPNAIVSAASRLSGGAI